MHARSARSAGFSIPSANRGGAERGRETDERSHWSLTGCVVTQAPDGFCVTPDEGGRSSVAWRIDA